MDHVQYLYTSSKFTLVWAGQKARFSFSVSVYKDGPTLVYNFLIWSNCIEEVNMAESKIIQSYTPSWTGYSVMAHSQTYPETWNETILSKFKPLM